MIREALQLLPYAVIAALSPLDVAATLAVMRAGRRKALAFAVGLVVGQLLATTVLVVAGAVAFPDRSRTHALFQGLLSLGFGIFLVVVAFVVGRRPEPAVRGSGGRTQAALARFRRVHSVTAAGAGVLLGIGGPKRLVISALAAASIAAAGVTGSSEAALIGWYVLLATSLVWGPVLAYLVLGDWVVARFDAAVEWLSVHRRLITVYALSIVGVALVFNAVVILT